MSTTDGAAATVAPKTDGHRALAALLDDAGAYSVTPQGTEGPYYFDVDRIRSDIREDRPGAPLLLGLRIRDAESCEPIQNAVVDIWHCDAGGLYSGFEAASTGVPGGGIARRSDEETYLRGAQVTSSDGIVQFKTIYPGWYPGRTIHIHAKVHLDNATALTTQLYLDDAFTERVFESRPYVAGQGRDTLNADDSIFDEALLLALSGDPQDVTGVLTFDVKPA